MVTQPQAPQSALLGRASGVGVVTQTQASQNALLDHASGVGVVTQTQASQNAQLDRASGVGLVTQPQVPQSALLDRASGVGVAGVCGVAGSVVQKNKILKSSILNEKGSIKGDPLFRKDTMISNFKSAGILIEHNKTLLV
jgi:hypothetical protein